jgi:RDD family protein
VKNSLDDFDLTSPGSAGGSSIPSAVLEVAPEEPTLEPDASGEGPLFDLPLRGEPAEPRARASAPPAEPREESRSAGPAPLSSRIAALAADSAFVLLLTAAPLLAATAGPARLLSPRGLWWTAVFAVYLSFFATVVPLALFGKTVGMALTGLTARGLPESPSLSAAEASRRWLGTLAAVAGLGIPLLVRRDPRAPSVADRLSGRPLSFED